jgi:Tfp pilus assembly protein PilN
MAIREINLVPFETLARQRLSRHLTLWAICATVVFLGIFASHLYQDRKLMALKQPSADMAVMDRDLASRVEQIQKLQADYDRLKVQQAALENVTAGLSYSKVLFRLARVMNEFTWLSSLDMDRGRERQGGILLRLTGFSLRNEELGDFLTGLSRDPLFGQVSLRHVKEARVAQSEARGAQERMDGVQFEIECQLL